MYCQALSLLLGCMLTILPPQHLAVAYRDAPFLAEVLTVKELHAPSAERSCIHVELDITGSRITYTAGDHVSYCPIRA